MIHYWGNVIEGVLWIAISGIIYFLTRATTDEKQKQISRRAIIAFFWFGISDFIEIGTGAWYRPVWLLMLKSVCVLTLVHCLFSHNALRKEEAELGQTDEV